MRRYLNYLRKKEKMETKLKQAIFHLKRDSYEELTTLGTMLNPDGSLFGQTLEDVVRPHAIKDKHYTAIPATEGDFTYFVEIRVSSKYGEIAVIYTEKEETPAGTRYILKYGGIRFTFILVHGGNRHQDSSGCVLCARHRNKSDRTISGSLKVAFREAVKKFMNDGYDVRLRVTNLPQSS